MVHTSCAYGGAGHDAPFWRCTQCHKVLCLHCTRETGIIRGPNGKCHRLTEVEDAVAEVQAAASNAAKETVTNVWQHPQRPLPFYVLDGQKLADTEKLAWVRQELEENADIEAFCKTFLDIFADKFTTAVAQKKTALRLWCMHNGRKVITASIDFPADEL